ncbi:MAG: phage tail tape measure protein, partial [Bacteroides sp.]|nr:phage tail tape measure protein [Bacteroides sp.]
MAKDKVVKRGVYLYLDGSEIKNDIKSVETEMKGLISAQKKMTIGSEEYVRTAQKIRSLRGIINEHNAQLREVETNVKKNSVSIGKLADGFNRFFGLIGAGLAALTGFTLALRSLRDEKNKLEESQAGLKALTGLDDDSIAWLTGQAKKLSTSMTKEGLRVRQSANEILDAYMLIGSAKPELLGNKEALASVTEEAMRLQAAAKDITLNEAVDALTLSLNQYSEGADKAAHFTNVLAAGSKEGSANIASEAKAIRVAGVAAASAYTSIEQTVGLIQTLAYRGIKDEIAGTGLKKFFLTLQTGSDETNPKIVGLTTALDNLKKKQMDAAAIKKMFGEEGYNVASVLINETEQVKQFTQAVTGTNIATEQAAINSNTAAAKLAQAKNELKLAGIELADRLNPAMVVSTNMLTNLIKYLPSLIDWLKEWGSTVALSLAPVLLYNGAIKLMNAYHVVANGLRTASTTLIILHTAAMANATGNLVRYNTAMSAYNLMLNANSKIVKICTGLTYLLAAAKATLTGNTVKAGIAMKAFHALGMTNVFVAIATAVLAAGIALYKYATRTTEAQKAVKEFLAESTKERDELKKLTDAAQRAGDGTERRKQLIDEINSKYGQYLTNLLDEKSSLNDIKRAYKEINEAMDQNIAKKILDEKT